MVDDTAEYSIDTSEHFSLHISELKLVLQVRKNNLQTSAAI